MEEAYWRRWLDIISEVEVKFVELFRNGILPVDRISTQKSYDARRHATVIYEAVAILSLRLQNT